MVFDNLIFRAGEIPASRCKGAAIEEGVCSLHPFLQQSG